MAKLIEPGITKGEWMNDKTIPSISADTETSRGMLVASCVGVVAMYHPESEANARFIAASPRVARALVEMISFYKLACNRGDFGYPEQEAMAKRALDALLVAGYTESPDVK